jgi:hypothetical protein
VILLQSHEARRGMAVRVKNRHWKSGYNGMSGTVEHVWGDAGYPALDVRFGDGQLELFWFHELDEVPDLPTA